MGDPTLYYQLKLYIKIILRRLSLLQNFMNIVCFNRKIFSQFDALFQSYISLDIHWNH